MPGMSNLSVFLCYEPVHQSTSGNQWFRDCGGLDWSTQTIKLSSLLSAFSISV